LENRGGDKRDYSLCPPGRGTRIMQTVALITVIRRDKENPTGK